MSEVFYKAKTLLFTFMLLVGIIGFWVKVSSDIYTLKKQIDTTQVKTSTEKQELNILNAEWTVLTAPSRIEDLSKKLLPSYRNQSAIDIVAFKELPQEDTIIKVGSQNNTNAFIPIAYDEDFFYDVKKINSKD